MAINLSDAKAEAKTPVAVAQFESLLCNVIKSFLESRMSFCNVAIAKGNEDADFLNDTDSVSYQAEAIVSILYTLYMNSSTTLDNLFLPAIAEYTVNLSH